MLKLFKVELLKGEHNFSTSGGDTFKIALFDSDESFLASGWMCPGCESEFDLKDNLTYINGQNFNGGKA